MCRGGQARAERAAQEARERANREAQRVIDAQQKAMDRMESMIPEQPKYTPPPSQVESSYADSGRGVKTAKRQRKKSNLGKLRIKLNPSAQLGGQSTGTGPNLG